jgi:hypothetical protein
MAFEKWGWMTGFDGTSPACYRLVMNGQVLLS